MNDYTSTAPHGTTAGWSPPPRTSPRAIAVLVLGIASLTVLWGVAGIVALFLAPGAKREIATSRGAIGGAGLVRAGVICSWISLVLTILFLIAIAVLLVASSAGGAGVNTSVSVVGATAF